jgi:hypothetical protein
MIHYLYKTTNLLNRRYYIGVHSTTDAAFGTTEYTDDYVGSGKGIKLALRKYGRKNFLVEIISKHNSANAAFDAEGALITEEWLEINPLAYNLKAGGEHNGMLGYKFNDETRKLWSKQRTGVAPWNKGNVGCFTEKTLQQMSESHKGQHSSPETQFKKGHNLGGVGPTLGLKIHNQEFKDNLRNFVKERSKIQLTCHCGKTGGYFAMKRWHFNNCRVA